MPTYEYECTVCGKSFELFQNMSDPPLSDCPSCGKRVRRLIHGGMGVIFKGSGFYVTDNKKSSSPSKSAAAGKTEAKAEAKNEACEGCSSAPACESQKKEAV
jgi:putative FmdB family regulatory protein